MSERLDYGCCRFVKLRLAVNRRLIFLLLAVLAVKAIFLAA